MDMSDKISLLRKKEGELSSLEQELSLLEKKAEEYNRQPDELVTKE